LGRVTGRGVGLAVDKLIICGRTLELVQGDITRHAADAIGNAANAELAGGGGVDGAIHRAGGPRIMDECRRIGGCPTGDAVVTTAGDLQARYVIHAVGPIWDGGSYGEAGLLRSAYRRVLDLARQRGCASLALPSISTGVYGYPVGEAAGIALTAAAEHLRGATTLRRVTFVLYNAPTMDAYRRALDKLAAGGDVGAERSEPGEA